MAAPPIAVYSKSKSQWERNNIYFLDNRWEKERNWKRRKKNETLKRLPVTNSTNQLENNTCRLRDKYA